MYGANFVDGGTGGDPYDDNGHGTFVSGVVGAVGNNDVGIDGVSQVSSIICAPYRRHLTAYQASLVAIELAASSRCNISTGACC